MYAVMLDSLADALIAEATGEVSSFTTVVILGYVQDADSGDMLVLTQNVATGEKAFAHVLPSKVRDDLGHEFPMLAQEVNTDDDEPFLDEIDDF